MMDRDEFQNLAEQALTRIPERFRRALRNVAILTQDAPTAEQLRRGRVRHGSTLLGLYEGVPRTSREGRDPLFPDRIFLFQQPIEMVAAGDQRSLLDEITVVLWHEIGHHFGLNDAEIHRIERRILK
jgi:predicted Zn-dependent protease with MMP-like domain